MVNFDSLLTKADVCEDGSKNIHIEHDIAVYLKRLTATSRHSR